MEQITQMKATELGIKTSLPFHTGPGKQLFTVSSIWSCKEFKRGSTSHLFSSCSQNHILQHHIVDSHVHQVTYFEDPKYF